jgi:ribosomal protein S18 acetylase RimI-like enzyme
VTGADAMTGVGEPPGATAITVRPARVDEFETIGRLTVEAYRADGQLGGEHGYEKHLADVAARAEDGEVLVAVSGAQVLGSVTFVLPGTAYAELSEPGEAEFRMLAVDPAAQGRGVGEALVRACLARAAGLGCSAVVICARDFSAPAHRLYQRLGFVRVPELDWSPAPDVNLVGLRVTLPGRAAS